MKRVKFIILVACMALSFTQSLEVAAQEKTTQEMVEKARANIKAQTEDLKAEKAQADSLRQAQQDVYDAQNRNSQSLIWLIVAVCAVASLTVFYFKHKATFLSIIRIFTGGYRIKGDVTTLEAKKILTGAVYAEQQGAFLNTLKADLGSKLYTILAEWWDINGRDSAVETLNYLRDKGYAYYFPTVWEAAQAASDDERKAIIVAAMTNQKDADKAYEQTLNLIESKYILKDLDVEKLGVFGWDAGRLIFIARLCYDARYITEQEAWDYIDVAYAQAQKTFNSWEELANSYVIGRFLWKGKEANDGMQEIAEDLVKKPKSPWQQVAWKA
jgi:hypothetical protein